VYLPSSSALFAVGKRKEDYTSYSGISKGEAFVLANKICAHGLFWRALRARCLDWTEDFVEILRFR
jgi:hypothetical protein